MSKETHTVLILDDDEAVRESMVGFFEDRSWRVLSAASAEAALEVLDRERDGEPPQGAVVDIRLPGMDGNAFIRSAGKKQQNLACVICTGSPEYRTPADISAMPQVSEKVFIKPVAFMNVLEEALRRQIKICGGEDEDSE